MTRITGTALRKIKTPDRDGDVFYGRKINIDNVSPVITYNFDIHKHVMVLDDLSQDDAGIYVTARPLEGRGWEDIKHTPHYFAIGGRVLKNGDMFVIQISLVPHNTDEGLEPVVERDL